jgi:exopolysaccharide production protein ExoQ
VSPARVWLDRGGGTLANVMVWAVMLILIIPQDFDFAGTEGIKTGGNMVTRVLWLMLLGGSFALLSWRYSRAVVLLRSINPFLLLMLGLAALSYTWSIAPTFTMPRVLRYLTVVQVCACFALLGWRPRRFQQYLRAVLSLVCIASVALVIIDPKLGVDQSTQIELKDAWRGITIGKNALGPLAGVCVITWLHGLLTKQVSLPASVAGISVGLLCLFGSRSQTSIMAAVFGIMFMLLLMRTPGTMRRSVPYLVSGFAAIILIYALAVLRLVPGLEILLSPIQALTGKDLTFSGRVEIWQMLTEHMRLSPWLGSGYGAYWIGPDRASPSYEMLRRLYFYPTEGHNGYLDIINDLGRVGGVGLFGYFIWYIRDALRLFKVDRTQAALYLTLLFREFLADMSESHWLNSLHFEFLIMTLATMCLGRSLLQIRLDARARMSARAPAPAVRQTARRSSH